MNQILNPDGTVKQTVLGMDMEMNKRFNLHQMILPKLDIFQSSQ